jgi:hypothetical protein
MTLQTSEYPEVLLTHESTTVDQLVVFAKGGPLPVGSLTMTFDEFKAIGRADDCDCGLIQCICQQARQHKEGCPLRLSMTCAIPITCEEHDQDVCPICTPCTCS